MMPHKNNISYKLIFAAILLINPICLSKKNEPVYIIKTRDDAVAIFPKTITEIKQQAYNACNAAKQSLEKLIKIKPEERTFYNTAEAFDQACALFGSSVDAISIIQISHPDKEMRDAAQQVLKVLRNFSLDNFIYNKKLYDLFEKYINGNALKENLNKEQRYYLKATMEGFKRAGLQLPQEQQDKISALKKQIEELSLEFDTNINADKSFIIATKEQIPGLDNDFIDSLEKDTNGLYILKADHPTNRQVMEHCTLEDTRKRMYRAFANRAYPQNKKPLGQIIALRNQLAKELGYSSFAHLDIENQMIKTPEKAQEFLDNLIKIATPKAEKEIQLWLEDLADGVTLTKDGKVKPWDLAFIKEQYKQKHFQLDDHKVAEYFPLEKTIEALFDIYQQFLGFEFKEVAPDGLWHEDVKLVEVRNADDKHLRGYFILDLFPRLGKLSSYPAAQWDVFFVTQTKDGKIKKPGLTLVMANFPKSTTRKPSLLTHRDAVIFFHEFGHAMHSLSGTTELDSTSVITKRDFVETPSQMLEEWMYEPEILQKVSSHYQTGEPLPHSMISKLKELNIYDAGNFLTRQAMLAQLALEYCKPDAEKNIEGIMRESNRKKMRHIMFDPEDHYYASFGHLIGYGAKYYDYMWAKVFAIDLFDFIKKHGLLNREIGQKYRNTILAKKGSVDPYQLMKDFLGREPNQDAFIRRLGLH